MKKKERRPDHAPLTLRRRLQCELLERRRLLASVSGYAYLDTNRDGHRGLDEVGIPGVQITLSGSSELNANDAGEVQLSTLTSDSGFYAFIDLPAGNYTVVEHQPEAFSDANEAAEPPGAVVGNDEVSNIVLEDFDSAARINFGEAAVKPDYVSILWVLSSSADSSEHGAMLRAVVADAERQVGNVDLATRIRDDAENGAVTEPIALRDDYEALADEILLVDATIGVLQNDLNPELDSLHAEIERGPENGTISLDRDGSFSYHPDVGFTGDDSFIYRAVGAASSNPATVTIRVVPPPNRNPVAVADNYVAMEDSVLTIPSAFGVLRNDSDDGPLEASLVANVRHGTLMLDANGGFVYTPEPDFFGVDSFDYIADDGQISSNRATVTIDVQAVHDAPLAVDDAYELDQGETLSVAALQGVLANDIDVEFDITEARLEADVENGTLLFESDGAFLYTPSPDFSGTDSFIYLVVDQTGETDIGMVTITVAAVNSAPIASPDVYRIAEDTLLVITAPGLLGNDTDAEQDILTAEVMTLPANGSLALNADGSFEYLPRANYYGSDSFTYLARDATSASGATMVTITVEPQNDLPQLSNDSYVTTENQLLSVDSSLGVLANDVDVDGDVLTASLVADVINGTLMFNSDGSFSYQPDVAFNGLDSFTYLVNDGTGLSAEATVVIDVGSVNDPPVAVNDTFSTNEDVRFFLVNGSVLDNDSDIDGDTMTAELLQEPLRGTLTFNTDGTFDYLPAPDFFGEDSFAYAASDGFRRSEPAIVSITVRPVNDPPVANDDSYQTDEDVTLTIGLTESLLANDIDVDGDSLSVEIVDSTSNGTLSLDANGGFEYVPNQDFSGQDSFTYAAFDGMERSDPATVSISVRAVNDTPLANDDAYATNAGVPLVVNAATGVLANDTDSDGDSLTALIVEGPTGGEVALNPDGSFTYEADDGFIGADSFSYVASDDFATSGPATVVISVVFVNALPVAVDDDTYEVEEGNVLTVTSANGVLNNDTDEDGDILTAELVADASNGTVDLDSDGSFTYVPRADFDGTDSFTYRATDGVGSSNVAVVTITVQPAPDTVFGSITLPASKDSSLFESPVGATSNGAGAYLFVGRTLEASNFLRRALIAFDVSSIPVGATITRAELTLTMSRTIVGAFDVELHRITNDWGEGNLRCSRARRYGRECRY